MFQTNKPIAADAFWGCVCEGFLFCEEFSGSLYAATIETFSSLSVTLKNIATSKTATYLYDDYEFLWRVWPYRPSRSDLRKTHWEKREIIIQITPKTKRPTNTYKGIPNVFLNNRIIYFNNEAASSMGNPKYVTVSVERSKRRIYVTTSKIQLSTTYKTQNVKDAEKAFRLEYYDLSLGLLEAGVPLEAMGLHFPLTKIDDRTFYFVWDQALEEMA